VIFAGFYFFQQDKSQYGVLEDGVIEEEKVNEIEDKNWIESPEFGLYYDTDYFAESNEYYRVVDKENPEYLKPVFEAGDGNVPVFQLVFDGGLVQITWGDVWKGGYMPGTCVDSDFDSFEYGVSTEACVKGYRAWLSNASAGGVAEDEIKIFGDFVLKNK